VCIPSHPGRPRWIAVRRIAGELDSSPSVDPSCIAGRFAVPSKEMSDSVKSVLRNQTETAAPADGSHSPFGGWIVSFTSLMFILLQSACTAVMAISGVRVLIGLSALAAAAGLNRPASGFHADAIRIPMMILAVGGSAVNLYVIWRVRSLRSRPASQWRTQPVPLKQLRSEKIQIALAIVTLVLVAAEYATHLIVHNA